MTKVQELQAKVQDAMATAKAQVAEKMEVARLEAKLSVVSNVALQDAKVAQNLVTAATEKLKEIEMACENIVAEMPIYSMKTRENRKWNPSRQYGMGNQITILSGILSGIQYSAQDHKTQMLALTGLNDDLIEQTLEAFGSAAYYSKNYREVVPETAYDMNTLTANLALIGDILDVQLSAQKVTDRVMSSRFEVARLRAETARLEDEVAHNLDSDTDQTINV